MVIVWIPALLRDFTENQEKVKVKGETLRSLLDNLDSLYPGIKKRLITEDDNLRTDISVLVNGEISYERLRQKLNESDEVYFVPVIAGGQYKNQINFE